jgi:hypothetical protein
MTIGQVSQCKDSNLPLYHAHLRFPCLVFHIVTEFGDTTLGWRLQLHTTVVSYGICKLFVSNQSPVACVVQYIILYVFFVISGKWMV